MRSGHPRLIVNACSSVLNIFECGARLRMFLYEVKRVQESTKVEAELFDIIMKQLTASLVASKSATQTLFSTCLEYIVQEGAETILDYAIPDVLEDTKSFQFQTAYDLSLLIHRFFHYIREFVRKNHIQSSFELCLYLAGRQPRTCGDEKLRQSMLELLKLILREALAGGMAIGMSISQLSKIVTLLGEQQNYESLVISSFMTQDSSHPVQSYLNTNVHQGILNNLWMFRVAQKTWSPTIVTWIGRRLVETQFCRGQHDDAIHMCENIRYNRVLVLGALGPATLEITVLSEMYTERQLHGNGMALHGSVLSNLAYDEEEDLTNTRRSRAK